MGTVKKTETGSVLSFNTYLSKTLDETKISFTPKQSGSGTPSPENVREIVGKNSITVYQQGDDGVTHETSVSFPAVGKNLFNGEWRKGRYIDRVWNNTNTWRTSELIPVEPNTTYCVSVNEPRTIGKIYSNLFDKNGNHIGYDYGTSVTTTADTALMTICNTKNVVSAWTDIQLEKGSTATAYEPFDNTVYGGYVDIAKGELVAEWTKVDMGDLNWSLYEKCWTCIPSDIKTHSRASSQVADLVCDIYEQGRVTTASQFRDTPEGQLVARNDYKNIGIKDSTYATAADFKTAVTGHYLAYKLAEPIHYPLSPRILTTLQGNNVMWSDGDSLTISYTDDIVNTYDFRRHISLDTPHKASASGAVASFGTDMVGKMKCKIHFLPQQEGSGTPSPDNVRNISGRSSVKVWRCRENLWDKSTATAQYVTASSGIQTSDANNLLSDWIKVEPNKTYVYSYKPVIDSSLPSSYRNLWTGCGYYTTTSTGKTARSRTVWKETSTTNIQHITISIPENCYYIRIGSRHLDMVGAWATFEPYDQTQIDEITFTFPSTVGDNGVVYGGYVDLVNGEVVAEKDGLVFDGSEAWYLYVSNEYACVFALKPGRKPLDQNEACSHFKINGQAFAPSANHINSAIWGSNSGTVFMQVSPSFASDVTAFKQFLADEAQKGTPVTIVADALNPIHYSLTPQSIATLRGSNRIWSDGDSVEVEYYKHTDEPQEYLPIDAIVTNNGFVLVTSDGYAVGEANDYIKY